MGDEHQGHATGTTAHEGGSHAELVARVHELEREVREARRAALVSRDHVVGIEAEIGRQNADILRMHTELRKAQARGNRLDGRKRTQAKRIKELQAKLRTARARNAALDRRIAELSAAPPSLARRVARKLRGRAR